MAAVARCSAERRQQGRWSAFLLGARASRVGVRGGAEDGQGVAITAGQGETVVAQSGGEGRDVAGHGPPGADVGAGLGGPVATDMKSRPLASPSGPPSERPLPAAAASKSVDGGLCAPQNSVPGRAHLPSFRPPRSGDRDRPRRADRTGQVRAEVPEPAADTGGGEPPAIGRLLPRAAKVRGRRPEAAPEESVRSHPLGPALAQGSRAGDPRRRPGGSPEGGLSDERCDQGGWVTGGPLGVGRRR